MKKIMMIIGAVALMIAVGCGSNFDIDQSNPEAVAKAAMQAIIDGQGEAFYKQYSLKKSCSALELDDLEHMSKEFNGGKVTGAKVVLRNGSKVKMTVYVVMPDGTEDSTRCGVEEKDGKYWIR